MNLTMLDRNGLIELRNRAEAFVRATDGLLVLVGELKPEPPPMLMSGDDPKPTKRVSQRRRSSGKRVKAVAPPASRRRAKAAVVTTAPAEARPLSPLQKAIVDVLNRQSLGSSALYESVKKAGTATTLGSVYQCCSDLKERGIIESYRDPDLPGSLWRVVGSASRSAAA